MLALRGTTNTVCALWMLKQVGCVVFASLFFLTLAQQISNLMIPWREQLHSSSLSLSPKHTHTHTLKHHKINKSAEGNGWQLGKMFNSELIEVISSNGSVNKDRPGMKTNWRLFSADICEQLSQNDFIRFCRCTSTSPPPPPPSLAKYAGAPAPWQPSPVLSWMSCWLRHRYSQFVEGPWEDFSKMSEFVNGRPLVDWEDLCSSYTYNMNNPTHSAQQAWGQPGFGLHGQWKAF